MLLNYTRLVHGWTPLGEKGGLAGGEMYLSCSFRSSSPRLGSRRVCGWQITMATESTGISFGGRQVPSYPRVIDHLKIKAQHPS